jgi:hypothetical protein
MEILTLAIVKHNIDKPTTTRFVDTVTSVIDFNFGEKRCRVGQFMFRKTQPQKNTIIIAMNGPGQIKTYDIRNFIP